ncbi:DUF4013 domain-containing protein [Methanobacterium sp. ACI-7]|uniref:DUF4013 domain-containing protein n=1 Tax=unclassified Methanobacterium TaxID=2627676 RepID=UPI0039C4B515
MDIGDIVGDAIRYPMQDWKKVIILGIISIISFLIIPVFLGLGYFLRIIKATIAGSDELPEFDEWGDMLKDGFKVFIVEFVYFIIPAIIIIIGMWAAIIPFATMQGPDVAVSTAAFGLIGGVALIGIIIAIIIGLIATIAIVNMAYYDGEIGAAFRFSEIMDHISRIGWADYIIWYIVMIIISIVIGIVAAILNVLIIGIIITPLIIAPFAQMFYARSLALLFASSE